MIDNNYHGIKAGIEAGCKTILFSNNKEQIEKSKNEVDQIISELGEINLIKLLMDKK